MAEIWPRSITVNGQSRPLKLVFRSRLVRVMNLIPGIEAGGLVLSAKVVRFKRSPAEIPRQLVAHELGHVAQAIRLGWRYLPTYLVRRARMEWEADESGVLIRMNVSAVERPAWLDKFTANP